MDNEISPSNGKEIVSNSDELRNECGGEWDASANSTLSMKTMPVEFVRVSETFVSMRGLGIVVFCELAALPNVVKLTCRSDPELELNESIEPENEEGMALLCWTPPVWVWISSSSNDERVCGATMGDKLSFNCETSGSRGISFVDGESKSRRSEALV